MFYWYITRPVWNPLLVQSGGHSLRLHCPDGWCWGPGVSCFLPGLSCPQRGRLCCSLYCRVSFLTAHHVCISHLQRGTDYQLRLRFVNLQADGKMVSYPLQLHCSLQGQWSTREIVCDKNYMEVTSQHSWFLNQHLLL